MSKNNYSFSEFISTAWALVLTRISYPYARLIRRPFYIRGKYSLEGAKGLTTGHACRLDLEGDKKTLFIGDNCEIGDMTHIVAHEHVEFGNNVLIASKCFISDTSHGIYKGDNQDMPFTIPKDRSYITKSVKIGNNVWVGENVVILAGVEIGDGCIIGANSVVSKSIPKNTIAVGAPAKVIKEFDVNSNKWISNDEVKQYVSFL